MLIQNIDYRFLGYAIRHRRTEAGLKRIDLVESLKETYTLKTIQRIEYGEKSRLKNIYKDIGYILSFDVCENEDTYDEIEELVKRTYDIICSGQKISRYESLLKENQSFLNKHANEIYLSELARLNIAVLRQFLYNRFDDPDLIAFIKYHVFELDGIIAELCAYLLTCATLDQKYGLDYKDYLSYARIVANKRIFRLEHFYYLFLKHDNLLVVLREYENRLINHHPSDPFELISLLNDLSGLCLNLSDYDGALKYVLDILAIPNLKEIVPLSFYYHLNKRIGTIYFYKKDYENSYKYLLLVARHYPDVMSYNYIFLCLASERLNKEKEVLKTLSKIKFSNKEEEKVAQYFIKKWNKTLKPSKLEDYITDILKPILEPTGSTIYLNLFYQELENLASISGNHYKMTEFSSSLDD